MDLPACSPLYESRRHPAGQNQDPIEGETQGEVGMNGLSYVEKGRLNSQPIYFPGFNASFRLSPVNLSPLGFVPD